MTAAKDTPNVVDLQQRQPAGNGGDRLGDDRGDFGFRKLLREIGREHGDLELLLVRQVLATRFLEYARNGNRSQYEAENFARRNKLIALALAECAEGQGRFVDEIVNGIWLICEETYW